MTTRIGDVFMLIGIVALYNATGTLSFRDIFTAEATHELATVVFLGIPLAQFIFFLLFAGTIGKSAQFPLHTWLPDAMEGPTPVSAMIHAAAMVSAGVYMVIRMFPLLAGTAEHGHVPTFDAMAVVGAFSALMASTIALAQNDVKRVLAYSTIAQLGYMIAALGIGTYVAAAFHLITHAFFKALLFLGSGSIIHGVEHGMHKSHELAQASAKAEQVLGRSEAQGAHHAEDTIDPQNMLNMGGLRQKMPLTFWTFLIGGLSLAGFPLITAGFWSKDEILADALKHAPLVFWVLALSAVLTAFYTMRQIGLTFLGKPRTESAAHAHESHWTMTLPLVILAVFALTAGFVGVKPDFPVLGPILRGEAHGTAFEAFVAPTVEEVITIEAPEFDPTPVLASISIAVIGVGPGGGVYGANPLEAGQPDPLTRLGGLHTFLKNKWYFDELYDWAFVQPSIRLGVGVYKWIDRWLIDGVLHAIARGAQRLAEAFRAFDRAVVNGGVDAFVEAIKAFGRWFREVQTGWVQQYLYVVVLGVLVLAALYLALLS